MDEKESKVQKRAMDIVRKHGGYIYKNQQSAFTEGGRPDLTACIPVKVSDFVKIFGEDCEIGLFVTFEMKRLGHLNEVSEAQKITSRKIKKAGGLWFAVDNTDLIEALMIKLRGEDNAL